MTQKLTILFDLDGTLADTAPDLMKAHNFVMDKFGYSSKSMDEIRNLVGRGAAVMIGRSIWGSARKELSKISDDKIKKDMTKEFGLSEKRFRRTYSCSFVDLDKDNILDLITVNDFAGIDNLNVFSGCSNSCVPDCAGC